MGNALDKVAMQRPVILDAEYRLMESINARHADQVENVMVNNGFTVSERFTSANRDGCTFLTNIIMRSSADSDVSVTVWLMTVCNLGNCISTLVYVHDFLPNGAPAVILNKAVISDFEALKIQCAAAGVQMQQRGMTPYGSELVLKHALSHSAAH